MITHALHADAETCDRMLVVCTRYVGDTLLAIPFLRNLRRAHPGAVIDVCAEGAARAVLEHCPYVDERISWARQPRHRRGGVAAGLSALASQAAWLRSRHYTRAYLLKPSLSAAALARLAGIPQRIGFAGESSPLLTRRVRRRRGRHQVETYLDLLRADGVDVDDGHNENWVPPAAARRVAALLAGLPPGRPRVFLAPRSTDYLKHWPVDRWRRLIHWMVDERGCEIVLCGGPADALAHAKLQAAVGPEIGPHVHDWSVDVPLSEAAALAARMDLCIGVDTGLIHMAASVGVPVVVLVGPTDPNRWSPWRTRSAILRSDQVWPSLGERLLTAVGGTSDFRWPLGRAMVDDIAYDDVAAAAATFLPPPALPTLDLRQGSYRYEVAVRSTASGGVASGASVLSPAPVAD
jgi:heptosyltransferase-2